MGDFNAKIGPQQLGEHAVRKFGFGSRNSRREMLVAFAERNRLRIMNKFFRKRENRKWTWKGTNSETKDDIDYILTGTPSVLHNVQVIGRVKTSDHRMVRSRIHLDLGKERMRMFKPNMPPVGSKVEEFRLLLENNKFSVFNGSNNLDTATSRSTNAVIQSAVAVGGIQTKLYESKLYKKPRIF